MGIRRLTCGKARPRRDRGTMGPGDKNVFGLEILRHAGNFARGSALTALWAEVGREEEHQAAGEQRSPVCLKNGPHRAIRDNA